MQRYVFHVETWAFSRNNGLTGYGGSNNRYNGRIEENLQFKKVAKKNTEHNYKLEYIIGNIFCRSCICKNLTQLFNLKIILISFISCMCFNIVHSLVTYNIYLLSINKSRFKTKWKSVI